MHKIGEFSTLSKITVKALRYYEKTGLLYPSCVDQETGYRFYETKQLLDVARIVSFRQIGLSIDEIKEILDGKPKMSFLTHRKNELEQLLKTSQDQLSRIDHMLEGKNMKYEVIVKELPSYPIYYKEGMIDSFDGITDFILSSAEECRKDNPNIECITPDYCYINYLDGEYKDHDIKIRYAQAVTEIGISNETIHFETLEPVSAVCIYHKGDYKTLGEAYGFIMKWIEDHNYKVIESPRERYIDGIWNKENKEDWVTEIQIPVKAY